MNPHKASDANLGFYFLKDTSITLYNLGDKSEQELAPTEKPWLSATDMAFYDFSSHCIYLKGEKNDLFPGHEDDVPGFFPSMTKPFWVMAGDVRCYLAAFHSGASSLGRYTPYFDELSLLFYPADVLPIHRSWEDIDVRHNEHFKQALQQAGLYHAGLSLVLLHIKVLTNDSIATLQYDYQLTNNDTDDLLVLDQDKMGARFHYYTNGPVLWNSHKQLRYQSEHKKVIPPEPPGSWEPDWFSTLKSGQSRTWSVALTGYDRIESGTYEASLWFANPTQINRKDRHVSPARYWLGEINSPIIHLNL
ncbi:hypothetical protein EH223_14785 [candidate division KSB1 bacterium]|nr:MAG: hypothetical protein EH223_14785 [candidate division KSB1 bacterium]